MRADINIIDFDALEIAPPQMVFDLPAGGRRMIQTAKGYRHTFLKGVETFAGRRLDGCKTGHSYSRTSKAGRRCSCCRIAAMHVEGLRGAKRKANHAA